MSHDTITGQLCEQTGQTDKTRQRRGEQKNEEIRLEVIMCALFDSSTELHVQRT